MIDNETYTFNSNVIQINLTFMDRGNILSLGCDKKCAIPFIATMPFFIYPLHLDSLAIYLLHKVPLGDGACEGHSETSQI